MQSNGQNMTKTYYYAQEALKEHNNKKVGISFGGINAGMNNSHESAMIAGLNIAKNLSNKYNIDLPNLNLFDKKYFDINKSCCSSCCVQ